MKFPTSTPTFQITVHLLTYPLTGVQKTLAAPVVVSQQAEQGQRGSIGSYRYASAGWYSHSRDVRLSVRVRHTLVLYQTRGAEQSPT